VDPRAVLVELAEATTRGDIDAIRERFGNERLAESMRRLKVAFPDAVVEPEWTIVENNRAAGWASIRGTHQGEWRGLPATGRTIDVHGMIVIQVGGDHDQIEDFWLANDWLSIATQLGVPLALPSV
jgi:predicted ester cyclase